MYFKLQLKNKKYLFLKDSITFVYIILYEIQK